MSLCRESLPRWIALALALALVTARGVDAQRRILVNTHPSGLEVFGGLHYKGGAWSEMNALIDGTFRNAVTRTERLTNLHQMLQHDVLWVDQRFMDSLTVQERVNLRRFEMTGRRIVVIGENSTWGPWNADVLGVFGAEPAPVGCAEGVTMSDLSRVPAAARLSAQQLTAGVDGVSMACAGSVLSGGAPLFDYAVSALVGVRRNVLTILDANVLDTQFPGDWGDYAGNRRFKRNIVSWLSGRPAQLHEAYTHPWPSFLPTQAMPESELAEIGATLDVATAPPTAVEPESPERATDEAWLEAIAHRERESEALARAFTLEAEDGAAQLVGLSTSTPEPATLTLVGAGLAAVGALRRRRGD